MVWDAIEDTPEAAEEMRLRSTLMMDLQNHLKALKMSETQAAALLDLPHPRIVDLMQGKIDLFEMDALMQMAAAVGLNSSVQARRKSA